MSLEYENEKLRERVAGLMRYILELESIIEELDRDLHKERSFKESYYGQLQDIYKAQGTK